MGAAMSAATSELPEEFGDALRQGDLVALHRTLHALPDDTLRAAAAALPPAEASLLMSAACLPPEKVALAISTLAGGATSSAEGSYAPALGVIHEVLLELPDDARDALQARLPAAARPLVGLAADLDAQEFGEAAASVLEAIHPEHFGGGGAVDDLNLGDGIAGRHGGGDGIAGRQGVGDGIAGRHGGGDGIAGRHGVGDGIAGRHGVGDGIAGRHGVGDGIAGRHGVGDGIAGRHGVGDGIAGRHGGGDGIAGRHGVGDGIAGRHGVGDGIAGRHGVGDGIAGRHGGGDGREVGHGVHDHGVGDRRAGDRVAAADREVRDQRVGDRRKGDVGEGGGRRSGASADPGLEPRGPPPRDATSEAVGGAAEVRHLEGRALATLGVVARAQLRRQQRWAAETYQSSGAAHPRLAGLSISAAACGISVLSCLLSLLTLRLAHAYITAFAGALAALLALLEADGATCASLAKPLLRRSPCLRPPSGRACAYALLSLLCLSSWPHPTSLLALAALLPAAGYARAHARAAPLLRQLRSSLADAAGVRAAFESSSVALGGERSLRGAQLARLVPALDAADMLAVHGVETALSPLGGHCVTLASALEWWAAVDAAHAPRPLSLVDYSLALAGDERAFSAPNRADPYEAAGNETPAPAWQQLLLVWQRYWPRYPSVAALLLGGALSLCAALLELLDVAAAAVGGVWPPTLSPCLAAAAAVLCGATLAVDGAQLPSPLGPKLRAVALPLLHAWPPLSLGVVRSLLALLALALLAVEEGWRGESSYAAGFVELLALLPLLFACVAARRIPAALLTLDAAAMVPLPCSDMKEAEPSHPSDWGGSLSFFALAEIVALDATEVGDALVTLDIDRDGRVSDEDLLAWAGLHAPAGGSSP